MWPNVKEWLFYVFHLSLSGVLLIRIMLMGVLKLYLN